MFFISSTKTQYVVDYPILTQLLSFVNILHELFKKNTRNKIYVFAVKRGAVNPRVRIPQIGRRDSRSYCCAMFAR